MMASATEILERQQAFLANFGSEPLLVLPDGRTLDLATGYIPLLSSFTTEDKAAKGLRKGKETSSEPVYFSLLDLVRDNQILLLSGPTGSGKSTFAKHLCFSLAGQDHSGQHAACSDGSSEILGLTGSRPCYFAIDGPEDLEALACRTIPTLFTNPPASEPAGLVIVVDAIEHAGPQFAEHIASLAAQISDSSNMRHRLVLLCNAGASSNVVVPLAVTRYNVKPLSLAQRQNTISKLVHLQPETIDHALGDAASNPALFALALQAQDRGDQAEALLDAWLDFANDNGVSAADIEQNAFLQICEETRHISALKLNPESSSDEPPLLARSGKVKHLLAGRYLSSAPTDITVALYKHDPIFAANIVQSLLIRLRNDYPAKFDDLTQSLLQEGDVTSHRAALLIAKAGSVSAQLEQQISHAALAIIEEGQLPIPERQDAASVLSRFGDPRHLAMLVKIPASTITLGSNTNPNSQPVHQLHIDAFHISVFPVTIQQYAAFAAATARPWASPDQHDECKQNFPATDVTWHDAVAYCEWLTARWRANGTISENEQVRLPSEPEWEKASSSGQDSSASTDYLYPWGTQWHSDAFNGDETGLNQPCAVGLFPRGRSLSGCHDMAGNIWEWCSTLWGEDMAAPSYCYPWRDDGREAVEAPPAVRRVLRGGCFSSGRMKANCTYRGSLEPSGYWRGNGFRVVVARC